MRLSGYNRGIVVGRVRAKTKGLVSKFRNRLSCQHPLFCDEEGSDIMSAWNFGKEPTPATFSALNVSRIAKHSLAAIFGRSNDPVPASASIALVRLDIDKARRKESRTMLGAILTSSSMLVIDAAVAAGSTPMPIPKDTVEADPAKKEGLASRFLR